MISISKEYQFRNKLQIIFNVTYIVSQPDIRRRKPVELALIHYVNIRLEHTQTQLLSATPFEPHPEYNQLSIIRCI